MKSLLLLLPAAAVLAACASSPPARYYTLQAPAGQAAPASSVDAGFMIEVLTVNVPAQADQPQIMVRTGEGSIAAMYSDRWSAPLGDELRAALSDGLTRDLGALDVHVVRPAPGTPVWRVQTDVQRFDMNDGGPAVLDVTWRARPISIKGRTLVCRSIITVPGTGGVDGLVTAQQKAAALLASTIASGIRSGGQRAEAAGPELSLRGCSSLASES